MNFDNVWEFLNRMKENHVKSKSDVLMALGDCYLILNGFIKVEQTENGEPGKNDNEYKILYKKNDEFYGFHGRNDNDEFEFRLIRGDILKLNESLRTVQFKNVKNIHGKVSEILSDPDGFQEIMNELINESKGSGEYVQTPNLSSRSSGIDVSPLPPTVHQSIDSSSDSEESLDRFFKALPKEKKRKIVEECKRLKRKSKKRRSLRIETLLRNHLKLS